MKTKPLSCSVPLLVNHFPFSVVLFHNAAPQKILPALLKPPEAEVAEEDFIFTKINY